MPSDNAVSESSNPGTGPVGDGDHEVLQGESVKSIAASSGLYWEKIWNHTANRKLREIRKDPNILLPEDRIAIPLPEIREVDCPTEKRHQFELKGVMTEVRIVIKDKDKPRRDESYTLTIDGGLQLTGKTDANGMLLEKVPVKARSGELIIGPLQDRFRLDFSYLDPISELSGIQERLNNLGFYCGPSDGIMSSKTAAAIQAFQNKYGLQVTGIADKSTLDKLKQEYGS
jgi:hypothetical protein